MLRFLLLYFFAIPASPTPTSAMDRNGEFVCILRQDGKQSLQLWAIPNRQGIDVQSFAEKRLPVTYVHEMGLVMYPPRNVNYSKLSIREISEKQTLITVDLSGTNASDDDVRVLSALPDLEYLVLDSTNVTDACLEPLKQCKKLQLLSLHGCEVSNDALAELQRALPGLVRITGEGQTVVPMRSDK